MVGDSKKRLAKLEKNIILTLESMNWNRFKMKLKSYEGPRRNDMEKNSERQSRKKSKERKIMKMFKCQKRKKERKKSRNGMGKTG